MLLLFDRPACSVLTGCHGSAQEYLDEHTAHELRTYSLPAVVQAVRSFAVGGARAPACAAADPGGAAEQSAYRGVTRDAHGTFIALLYASLE